MDRDTGTAEGGGAVTAVTIEVYGDDKPDAVRHLIDVHFFAPWTYDTAKRIPKVCLALESAGFTYPVVTNAGDQEGQHIVFDCEDAGGVPGGGD